ncbi:hypothetical protein [Algoriphagus confluentis]|uniref:Uncharacterized protein n=1 Tax=Algoriphagus confluentis TaxID=1697556 RepID=A0ABQ6PMZ1_9BACT|nr:hypothetical protein Aconfl_11660 [Algoriphagus confluentis]
MSFDPNIFLPDFQYRKEILYFGSAFAPNMYMKNHLLFPITLLLTLFLLLSESFVPNKEKKPLFSAPSENIKIRESTLDLQVSIGDKLFVFGKKSGTLDMVKVGMDLLPFAQQLEESNPEIQLKQIMWKRLKNGTVQIISKFDSWPSGLVWSIFPDGKLKMEATGEALTSDSSSRYLGLDFDFPVVELRKVIWKEHSGAYGEWDLQAQSQHPPQFFASFDFVDLVFDQMGVHVRSDGKDVGLEWKSRVDGDRGSDIRFVLQGMEEEISGGSIASDLPDSFSGSGRSNAPKIAVRSISLWFDFQ